MTREEELVGASRVTPLIPPGGRGLWAVRRNRMPDVPPWKWESSLGVEGSGLGPGDEYTSLHRYTDKTIYSGGEVVMEDTPRELRRHLPVLRHAYGRVLVTGLGLGCVVRGLLHRPEVDHVDVVEIDPHVAELVWTHLWPVSDLFDLDVSSRVTLHIGDALTYRWPLGARWDFAWHDIWSEDPHTQRLHGDLLLRYALSADRQGAWMFPRAVRRRMRRRGTDFLDS